MDKFRRSPALNEYADGKKVNQILHDSSMAGLMGTAIGGAFDILPYAGKTMSNIFSKFDDVGMKPAFASSYRSSVNGFNALDDAFGNIRRPFTNKSSNDYFSKVSNGGRNSVKGPAEAGKLYNVRGNMVTEKEFDRLRQQAVRKAWNQEEELVRKTGRGTYDWNEDEIKDLLTPYKEKGYRGVKGYEGQHMKSAKEYPDFVDDPNNIQFLKGRNMEIKEHFEAHGRNYQNPTNGYYDPQTKVTVDFGDEVPWKK